MDNKTKKAEYDQKYAKENLRNIRLSLNKEHDADIIAWLDQQPNKQGYLKELVRKDIEQKNK